MPSCAAFSRATDVNAEASPESERVQGLGAAMALEGHEAVHWILHRVLGGVHVGIDRADYTMLTVMPVSAKSRGRPRHPLRHGLGGLDGRVEGGADIDVENPVDSVGRDSKNPNSPAKAVRCARAGSWNWRFADR